MPFWALAGGILKAVGTAGKVVGVARTVGGVINNATTPYYSEAGQRVQSIVAGMQPEPEPAPTATAVPRISQQIVHDSNGNMVGYINGVEVVAKKNSNNLPTWLPLGLLGVAAIILISQR